MAKTKLVISIFCSSFIVFCLALLQLTEIYAENQILSLKYKGPAIKTNEDKTITGLSLSNVDMNNDHTKKIVITGNGYAHIFEWNGTAFESKWISQQFSHKWGPIIHFKISPLVVARYYSDQRLTKDYLLFAYSTPKSSDIYKLTLKSKSYDLQKMSTSPFNWFDSNGTCNDQSSFLIGSKQHEKGNYILVYKWNGSELVEKWHGPFGTRVVTTGDILNKAGKIENVFLVHNDKQAGFLSCTNGGSIEWKEINIDANAKELMRTNRIDIANGRIGVTKKGSFGELWTVQYSEVDNDYSTKLYVSQYDGKKFAPLSRVLFRGINSDMIYKMIINDVDNDGVGEIIGIEEEIRKTISRKPQRGDTGEESNALLITSNLFLAKWSGKEYEIKWHRKAIDEKVRAIVVGDVTGDGNKEIFVTDDNGYLYVFDMPGEN